MNPNQELLRDALRRLDIAEQALSDARASLRDFERQTAGVPEMQPISTPPQQAPAPPPVKQPAQPAAQPQPHAVPPPYPWQAPRPRAPRDREKTLISAVAIGGTVITLAGVAFLVGLAIQAGLLGPVGRVVLAYIVAAALLGAGWWFRDKAAPAGVTALVATSLFAALATTFLVVT